MFVSTFATYNLRNRASLKLMRKKYHENWNRNEDALLLLLISVYHVGPKVQVEYNASTEDACFPIVLR